MGHAPVRKRYESSGKVAFYMDSQPKKLVRNVTRKCPQNNRYFTWKTLPWQRFVTIARNNQKGHSRKILIRTASPPVLSRSEINCTSGFTSRKTTLFNLHIL